MIGTREFQILLINIEQTINQPDLAPNVVIDEIVKMVKQSHRIVIAQEIEQAKAIHNGFTKVMAGIEGIAQYHRDQVS